jgi:Leucine-rich repeat (LRR) protein
MKVVSIILIFFTLIACNRVDKGNIIPLTELHKVRLYKDLDSLPKDLTQIYRLNLSEKKLASIPEIVYKMTNLQELDISNNQITEINKIEQLDKLQILNIGMNRITSIPANIDRLKHLKILNVYWNDIQSFPDSFYNNDSIEELDLTSMFKFDFLSNLPKIHRLKNLRRLNLGNNQIPDLKIKFSGLKNLTEFGYIRQEKINLRELILKLDSCPRLKVIHLSVNGIKSLPSEIVLLDSLENLNLYDNKIRELPNEITKMKNLKEISLSDNPIDTNRIRKIEGLMSNTKIIY